MPQGSKDSYTSKQKRQAQHIEEGYEQKVSERSRAQCMGNREQKQAA
jgi:hypothetical protein